MDTDLSQLDPEQMRRNLAITLGAQQPQLAALRAPAGPEMAAPGPITLPGQDRVPNLAISAPAVKAPRGTVQGDQAERARMLGSGAGVDQIYGKITGSDFGQDHPIAGKALGGLAQGIGKLGDIGLSAVAPALAINLPGTEFHHAAQVHGLNKQIGAEEGEQEKEAQTADLQSKPELKQAQLDLSQEKQNEIEGHHNAQLDAQLHQHGFKHDEQGNIVPLTYDEMSPEQQGIHDLKASQQELADATAALKKVQADPNSPQARIAQQRIDGAQQARAIALKRLGLSEQVFNARYRGTDEQGNPLPGAMLTDDGRPVGSSFSQNVRPTGAQRSKGNMAESADQQIEDMKNIVAKRQDIFGPMAGRTTDFTVWLGSQDPDAQRFRAARTIAGDHLAGTFGGRSEAALAALDNAIGQFKDNPAAVTAGLNQLQEANRLFLKAGKVKTAGSGSTGQAQTFTENGVTYNIPADQVQAFKKDHPNAR